MIKEEILKFVNIPDKLLDYLLSDGSVKLANKNNCGMSRRNAIELLNTESHGLKETNQPWRFFLESLTKYKFCNSCVSYKLRTDFYYSKESSDDLASECSYCTKNRVKVAQKQDTDKNRARSKLHYENNKEYYSEKAIRRRALQLSRIPKWANLDKIQEIYANRPEGHHVDHEVPLQGKNVCGLHVEYNLQYLTAEDNLRKGNSFQDQ